MDSPTGYYAKQLNAYKNNEADFFETSKRTFVGFIGPISAPWAGQNESQNSCYISIHSCYFFFIYFGRLR